MSDETEWTTITVPKTVKADLDAHRGDTPWGAFLEQLRQEHADPITLNDVEEIASRVSESVDSDVDESELGLAVADYLMNDYELPAKVVEELR